MSGGVSASSMVMFAGMGMQAAGAYSNSRNAKAAYGAQAQVQRNNALIAGWQADDALARGNQSALRVRMQARGVKGKQRAAMAANGVDTTTGSALDVLTDTDYFAEVDVATVKDNAAKEAWALRNQAAGASADASLLAGRAAAESPLAAGATSLLTSAGQVASRWYTPGGTPRPVDVPYG
jgi:hypothetical protein